MNTSDVLKYGHQTMLHTLAGLPQSEWETGGVCGIWSVKDIVAHLASYEQLLAEVLLTTFLESGPTPAMDMMAEIGGAAFNDRQVEMRQNKTSAEILAEYEFLHTQVLAYIAQVPPEKRRENGTLPWYGMEYDLDDFIVYSNYAHKREHCAEINVFRDSLEPTILS